MISVFPNSLRFCRGHSAAYGVLRKVFAGFLSFISFICAAFAQTYSDYYFIPTSGNNNKLNDVGNYNVGSISGEPAASLPDFNANVFITADSDGYTANSNYADFNARDVVFKVGDSGTGSNGAWFLLTENNTATIRGDFLFSARSAANWVQAESGVKVLSGANFQVLATSSSKTTTSPARTTPGSNSLSNTIPPTTRTGASSSVGICSFAPPNGGRIGLPSALRCLQR